jgi:hypothetical protein
MDLVKNTKHQVILMWEDDMSKVKKDVIDVKFTLIGRVYGAHAVVIY